MENGRSIVARFAMGLLALSFCLHGSGSARAQSAAITYAGTAANVSAPFGGPPFCSYQVAMSHLTLTVVLQEGSLATSPPTQLVIGASLTGTMTETASGCPFATYGTQPNSWSLVGTAVAGSTINIVLTGASSNIPASNATLSATINGGQLVGSLTIRRTDQSGNLAWVLTTPVTALSSSPAPAAPPPVFPMTVTSNITPTVASATAQFQPRPQDVGTMASVFVFAHAPASKVLGAKRAQIGPLGPAGLLDGGDPCVLAQVNSAGQLVPASGSSLTPAFTTVLGAQGQSVTLLNNAPTPGVAGATLFAGYGSDSASMLAGGVYQGAVTVPGTVTCATTLSTSAAPKSPGPLSGLWYDPAEAGWGIYFASRGAKTFVAWYTYDVAGKPKWYVSDNCAMAAGNTATSGICNGNLFEVSGPVFFGVPFDASRKTVVPAGTLQVRFTDADNASMTYSAAGITRTVPITRQPFGVSSPVAIDFTDLWFNTAEDGWGMAVTHHFANMFLAWFVYDSTGKPIWYVSSDCTVSGNGCGGQLFRTTGPPFGPTFAGSVVPFPVGTVKLDFTGPNDGTVTYTVDGVAGSKTITRQTF